MVRKQSATKSSGKHASTETSKKTTGAAASVTLKRDAANPHFWDMKFWPERGYNLSKAHQNFLSTVDVQHWDLFVQHRAYYLEQLVREFYAGILKAKGGKVQNFSLVRGRKIFFDEKRLNDHYNLLYTGDNFENKLKNFGKKEMNIVKSRVAVPNSPWQKFTHTECKLLTKYINPDLGNWHTFINYSILPTSHTYSVSKDRMILLDCILSDEYVDIGKIISKGIRDCAEKREGFLFFPCLITELCMNQGVQISVEEQQYRQHPQGALSAEMKERKIAKQQANLVQDQLEQQHLMQKHLAVWKFQQEQHEWLQQRLLEISQLPTVLDTPEFPSWVFEDEAAAEGEEEDKVEEEEESKKKKAGKRKREDERKRKGKKKVTEEVEELEETEEETETEELMKDMEREEEEDSEDTISEHDSELDLTMDEMLKRASTERNPPQPPPQNSPQQPTQQTTQTTSNPKQAEPVVFTNPNISKENLQVINEEPEEGSITGAGGSGLPKADATASGAIAPEATASQQRSKEQAENTIQVVLRELEKRRMSKDAELLQGLAEATGIFQKTPTPSEAVKETTGEKEAGKKEGTEKGGPQEKAVEDPKDNQPSLEEAAEEIEQPVEVAAQSSAVAPGATAPAESTGATAPPTTAATRPPKLRIKRAATRASNRLRSGPK